MWVTYKTKKDDETFVSILKKFKVKDANLVLKYSGNKKILPLLKGKNPLKKGVQIWMPDPKAKVYVVDGANGKMVFTDKDYIRYRTGVGYKVDKAWGTLKAEFDLAASRHDFQRKALDSQVFVKFVLSRVSSFYPEPNSARKKAENACKQLETAAKSRNYKKVQTVAPLCEKAIRQYQSEVYIWLTAHTGGAEKAVTGLVFTRELGKICGAVAAVTILAPATLGATLLYNGLATAGVGLAYDGADGFGRAMAGTKQRSAGEIGVRTLLNAITGVAGAGFSKLFMATVGQSLAKYILRGNVLKNLLKPIVKRIGSEQWVAKVLRKIEDNLVKDGFKRGSEMIRVMSEPQLYSILIETLTLIVIRGGTPALLRYIKKSAGIQSSVDGFLRGSAPKIASMKPQAVEALALKHLANSTAVQNVVNDMINDNMSGVKKVFEVVAMNYAKNAR